MSKCLIVIGLVFNLVGVVLIFLGLKVPKDAVAYVKDGKAHSYLVSENKVMLNLGLGLIGLGTLMQIIGTSLN